MSWVKLPDEWMDSPEVLEAGPLATCVFLWALSYSAQHLTDGHISRTSLKGCSLVADRSQRSRVTRRLVATGFWVEAGDGFDIIDWERFLRKRAEVLEERAAATLRKQRQREREGKRRSRRDIRDGHGAPDPTRKGRGGTTPPLSDEDGSRRSAQSAPLGTASSEDLKCRGCGKTLGSAYGSDWDWLDDEMTIRWCDGCFRTPGLLEQYHEARKRAAANGSVGSGQVDAHDLDDIDLGGTA